MPRLPSSLCQGNLLPVDDIFLSRRRLWELRLGFGSELFEVLRHTARPDNIIAQGNRQLLQRGVYIVGSLNHGRGRRRIGEENRSPGRSLLRRRGGSEGGIFR